MPIGINPQAPDSINLTGQSGFFVRSQGSMPGDLLESARIRVRTACLVVAALWFYVLIMNRVVYPLLGSPVLTNGNTWAPAQTVMIAVGLIFSLGVAWWVNRMRSKPATAIDVGLAFEVLTALLVALVTEWVPRHDTNAVSWLCVVILLYPAIAPATTGKTLVASLASASTYFIAIGVALLRGLSFHPTLYEAIWLIMPQYLCAILAIVPATVIRGLGRQVRKARELGSYTLQERLGVGGMGEVYRGTHRLLARPAALKLINPKVLNSGREDSSRIIIERFRREAEAAATLRSPHTIELYDFGVADDGTFYYVMELLEGLDLEKLVSRFGPVPAERAVHFLAQACDSLGEAHLRGLVHRDLKPSNLFACKMGLEVDYVKVLDFGLVKNTPQVAAGEQMRLTAVDAISGTPAYMAPEMIGDSDAVGPAADVYALGCVAYWLLTGRFVFQAPNATAMLLRHLQQQPEAPSVASPMKVPPALDALILECLAKEPEGRPANAVELGRRLRELSLPFEWNDEMAEAWWTENMGKTEAGTKDALPPRADATLSVSRAFLNEEAVEEKFAN
jgi:tRNA A-37 threonylcarbamoyl transferase component Bud32